MARRLLSARRCRPRRFGLPNHFGCVNLPRPPSQNIRAGNNRYHCRWASSRKPVLGMGHTAARRVTQAGVPEAGRCPNMRNPQNNLGGNPAQAPARDGNQPAVNAGQGVVACSKPVTKNTSLLLHTGPAKNKTMLVQTCRRSARH